jgi:two-component system NtrC family sensor kinase
LPIPARFGIINSFRFQIVAGSILLLLISAVMLVTTNQRLIQSNTLEAFNANRRQISQMLNLSISPYSSTDRLEELKPFLEEMLDGGNYGISYLVVLRENGQVALQVGKVPQPLPAPDNDIAAAFNQGAVHSSQAILLENNAVADMRWGMNTSALLQTAQQAKRDSMVVVFIGILITGSLAVSMGVNAASRLRKIGEASQALVDGDYGKTVPVEGPEEFRRLASHFNHMSATINSRIDQLKQSQYELASLNEALEHRVEERTAALIDSNHQLEESVQHLNQARASLVQSEKLAGLGALVAGISHELNTPLGNALTVATTLAEETRKLEQEIQTGLKKSTLSTYLDTARTASDIIENNLHRAADLVSSFKQVAVDQSSSQRRRFNLKQNIGELLRALQPILKRQDCQLNIEIADDLELDSFPGPLSQVIANLINNALLHAFDDQHGGTIQLRAQADGLDHLSIEFGDNGKGIPAENLGRIFDPFFTTRLGQGGSGLGLNIVHNVVTGVLGGSIQVQSTLGQGTRFQLRIPRFAPRLQQTTSGTTGENRQPAGLERS